MRAQPHGGALRNGGTNRGGPGRMPEVLRAKSRDVYARWVEWAEKAVAAKLDEKDDAVTDEIMMQIGNTVGRYGLGDAAKIDADEVRARLQKQIDDIVAALPAADAERVLGVIRPAWDAA